MNLIGVPLPKLALRGRSPAAVLGYFILKGLKHLIPVTKEEAKKLRGLFPEYKITRTMIQKSHRHHYYAVESEGILRAIADTNDNAKEIVARIDKGRELRKKRLQKGG